MFLNVSQGNIGLATNVVKTTTENNWNDGQKSLIFLGNHPRKFSTFKRDKL